MDNLVNLYPATQRAITAVGMPHNTIIGNPWLPFIAGPSDVVIVLQGTPDSRRRGRVLHVKHDYNDGPADLAKAICKADPTIDPRKTPTCA